MKTVQAPEHPFTCGLLPAQGGEKREGAALVSIEPLTSLFSSLGGTEVISANEVPALHPMLIFKRLSLFLRLH